LKIYKGQDSDSDGLPDLNPNKIRPDPQHCLCGYLVGKKSGAISVTKEKLQKNICLPVPKEIKKIQIFKDCEVIHFSHENFLVRTGLSCLQHQSPFDKHLHKNGVKFSVM
jgi:hypothetical protein